MLKKMAMVMGTTASVLVIGSMAAGCGMPQSVTLDNIPDVDTVAATLHDKLEDVVPAQISEALSGETTETTEAETTVAEDNDAEVTTEAAVYEAENTYQELTELMFDIDIDMGVKNVEMTFPAEIFELSEIDVNDAYLSREMGFEDADTQRNQDGSVTFTISKTEYQEMLNDCEFDQSMENLIDTCMTTEGYHITQVDYSATELEITVDTATVKGQDLVMAEQMFTLLAFENHLEGKDTDDLVMRFYNSDTGEVIGEYDFSEMN